LVIPENCIYFNHTKTNNMSGTNIPAQDTFLEEPKKLPDMLNVLTILTFVGSGIGILSSIWSCIRAQDSYDKMVEAQSKLDSMPDFAKKFMGPEMVEMTRRALENRIPILILSLLSMGLCIYGAIQMRQFKKTGFTVYLIGELLPAVAGAIFIGVSTFGGFALIGYLIYAVFIILYATQLKYLK
jgi:hypothetical protein